MGYIAKSKALDDMLREGKSFLRRVHCHLEINTYLERPSPQFIQAQLCEPMKNSEKTQKLILLTIRQSITSFCGAWARSSRICGHPTPDPLFPRAMRTLVGSTIYSSVMPTARGLRLAIPILGRMASVGVVGSAVCGG